MCLPLAGAAAGSAAAISATTAIMGTVISAVGTAAGIAQGQASMQQQAQQARQQMDLSYRQAQQQAYHERSAQIQRYVGDVKAQQAATLAYHNQIHNNNEAANNVYVGEQQKLFEARQKAAFESQSILAKAIGAKGSVLASGATGQSVGLLMNDAERKAGFAAAQQNASIRSAEGAAGVAMEVAKNQNASANNQALSNLPSPVQHPLLAPDPVGVGQNLNLGIPAYQWA